MKEIKTNTIEQALTMYMETVSPSEDNLKMILSHIPEKKKREEGRAIRSPYMWMEITEFVMLCSIMLAVIPTFTKIIDDPFYQIDKQVEIFEMSVESQDYQDSLLDSGL